MLREMATRTRTRKAVARRTRASEGTRTASEGTRTRAPEAAAGRRSPVLRDERRAQLVAAAREVFGERGYHAATVDDITRSAGVAKGTFYLYFQEKREIYYELVRSFLQHVKDIGASVAHEVHTAEQFFQRCEKAAKELLRVFRDHYSLARLAYRESMSLDAELERMLREFYRDLARVEADNIRLGIELGLFRPVDPLICAYAHIGMVERVALGLLSEQKPPPPELVVRELLSIAFEGLRKR
jgi:AcrR family transcriptional regulator